MPAIITAMSREGADHPERRFVDRLVERDHADDEARRRVEHVLRRDRRCERTELARALVERHARVPDHRQCPYMPVRDHVQRRRRRVARRVALISAAESPNRSGRRAEHAALRWAVPPAAIETSGAQMTAQAAIETIQLARSRQLGRHRDRR